MGMFDSVYFTCPSCGSQLEEQSKSGLCLLQNYHQSSVPVEVISGMDTVIFCYHCFKKWKIMYPERISLTLRETI